MYVCACPWQVESTLQQLQQLVAMLKPHRGCYCSTTCCYEAALPLLGLELFGKVASGLLATSHHA